MTPEQRENARRERESAISRYADQHPELNPLHPNGPQSIYEVWESYIKAVSHGVGPLHPVQVQETRRAFYAGFGGCLDYLLKIGGDEVSEEQGMTMLESFHDECREFMHDAAEGRA